MSEDKTKAELKEANTCIGLGVSVGALGAGAAAISSAVCPLCVIVAPTLVAAGLIKRKKCLKEAKKSNKT